MAERTTKCHIVNLLLLSTLSFATNLQPNAEYSALDYGRSVSGTFNSQDQD